MSRRRRRARYALLMVVVLLCPLLMPGAIHAYFNSEESRTNRLETINMIYAVALIDEFDPSKPFDHKRVTATNIGDVSAFVRILVHPVVMIDDMPVNVQFGRDLDAAMDLRSTENPEGKWARDEFGYYYYLHRLLPGETAPHLFTKVTLADTIDESLRGGTLVIPVQLEAVASGKQAYRSAWFKTPTQQQTDIRDWLDKVDGAAPAP